MRHPDQEWKQAAVGRYRNGDTIRTDRYRFTQYTDAQGRRIARMLYDHQIDPDEDVNIAEQDGNAPVVQTLRARMTETVVQAP